MASPKVSEFCSESHSSDGAGNGVSSSALPRDCSHMSNEDLDEDADTDVDEDVDEDLDEDADTDVDEDVDEDLDEDADTDVDEGVDEDLDEDADEAADVDSEYDGNIGPENEKKMQKNLEILYNYQSHHIHASGNLHALERRVI